MPEKYLCYVISILKGDISLKYRLLSSAEVFRVLEEEEDAVEGDSVRVIRPSTNQEAMLVTVGDEDQVVWSDLGVE